MMFGPSVSPSARGKTIDRRAGTRGFSIVELLITLFVIAVLAAMAAPRFGGSIGRYRADLAAMRIAHDLEFARSLAMSRSSKQIVAFDPAQDAYGIVGYEDPDRAGRPYGVVLTRHPYEARVLKLDLGADEEPARPTIAFDGYGAPDSAGTIVIGVGSLTRTIRVAEGTGAVSVERE